MSANKELEMQHGIKWSWPNLNYEHQNLVNPSFAQQSVNMRVPAGLPICTVTRDSVISAEQDTKLSSNLSLIPRLKL
jgi:hypothetical protein